MPLTLVSVVPAIGMVAAPHPASTLLILVSSAFSCCFARASVGGALQEYGQRNCFSAAPFRQRDMMSGHRVAPAIAWEPDGRFERSVHVAPGEFAEICGKLPAGLKVG